MGEVDVVAVSVGDEEVLPGLQHVANVAQFKQEGDVVIGPAETFSKPYAESECLAIFVGVVGVGVVVGTASRAVEIVIIVVLVV